MDNNKIEITTDSPEGNAMAEELSLYTPTHARRSGNSKGGAGLLEATPAPWSISEVRTVEGEYMVVGGAGQEFGLISSCPVKADAELIVRLRGSGVLTGDEAWCQPMDCGKHTPRKFMIYFDDPDHGIMVFDNEADARAAFEKKNTAWNCYLFGALPLSPSLPSAHSPSEASK